MVVLGVHCGVSECWHLERAIYDRFGNPGLWTWAQNSIAPEEFRKWLKSHERNRTVPPGLRFGNHRKYQNLNDSTQRHTGTGDAIGSYVKWICCGGGHEELFQHTLQECSNDRLKCFDQLFWSMRGNVKSFGRTACFDYLTLVGNLNLLDIEAGSPYLNGATGPLAGARMLFSQSQSERSKVRELDSLLRNLGEFLGVNMQVIEDAICDWQKHPTADSNAGDCASSKVTC